MFRLKLVNNLRSLQGRHYSSQSAARTLLSFLELKYSSITIMYIVFWVSLP